MRWAVPALALACGAAAAAPEPGTRPAENAQARVYVTPEERRESGLWHAPTDWLRVAGLLELEQTAVRYERDGGGHGDDRDFGKTLQLGAVAMPVAWAKAELLFEYDDEGSDTYRFDEATLAVEAGDFELAGGMLYMPFGTYFSHFATGPVLEFGETRDTGVTLAWGPDERFDAAVFAYRGRARHVDARGSDWDWGAAFEFSPSRHGLVGAGYLADLADSDEGLLRDVGDRYRDAVAAWNAYAVVGIGPFELVAETVCALDSFRELEPDRNRPSAWNLEFAYFPAGRLEWAVRVEGSREVEDAPRRRVGVALSWRATRAVSLTLEYLRSWYGDDLAEDGDGEPVTASHQVGAQLSVAF